MATFDLTPEVKTVPGRELWGRTPIVGLPVSEQDNINAISLRDLEDEYRVHVRLDSANIHNTIWVTPLTKKIYAASYPLGRLLNTDTTLKISRETLGYWELYSRGFVDNLSQRLKNRAAAAKAKGGPYAQNRSVPMRSFHIQDLQKSSIQTIQKSINRVEFNSSTQINWDWLATYSSESAVDSIEHIKEKSKWSMGVDGEGAVNVANMRAWKNKINTSLRVLDVFVGNSKNEDDVANSIAMSLINLLPSGFAFIFIPRISSASVVAMIHLFSQCFEKTQLMHMVAEDKMYLVGEEFLGNLKAHHHKLLYEFCEASTGASNLTPFSSEYVGGAQFTETVEKCVGINHAVHAWRYDYYEKFLKANRVLSKSASAKTFERYTDTYLLDYYKDTSEQWISATGFIFIAGKK